jgi:hypothetical protein
MTSSATLRDLILDGYRIAINCQRYPCTNTTNADLVEIARRYGLDWKWFGRRWPYRCTRCGSRDVAMQLMPDIRPNSSPDRQRDLAAWKHLVQQLEEEERRRG